MIGRWGGHSSAQPTTMNGDCLLLHNPVIAVCPERPLFHRPTTILRLFIHFRTLYTQWTPAPPFGSITSALFSIQWTGGVSVSLFCLLLSALPFSPLSPFLCFHALTNVPICKIFVLITLQ